MTPFQETLCRLFGNSRSLTHSREGDRCVAAANGWVLLIALAWLVPLAGCRICASCEDQDYAAYGGAWQRTLRQSGRVGSVYDPAGGKASKLVDREDPETPDEQQRRAESERQAKEGAPRREGSSSRNEEEGSSGTEPLPPPKSNQPPDPADIEVRILDIEERRALGLGPYEVR